MANKTVLFGMFSLKARRAQEPGREPEAPLVWDRAAKTPRKSALCPHYGFVHVFECLWRRLMPVSLILLIIHRHLERAKADPPP